MSRKIVLDSSVIVKWLNGINENYLDRADLILDRLESGRIECYAPELAKYEVGNALSLGKKLKQAKLRICLDLLYSLPITFIPETYELSYLTSTFISNNQITYYDASFLALAKNLDAILVTDNIKHQRHSKIKVISLSDYQ